MVIWSIGASYGSYYYGGQIDPHQSPTIMFDGTEQTGLDTQLPVFHQIRGQVTVPVGESAGNLQITTVARSGITSAASTRTTSDGSYSLYVPEGEYLVRVCIEENNQRLFVYYGDVCLEFLDISRPLTGIDIDIPEYSPVSGTLRYANGQPISGVDVFAIDAVSGYPVVSCTVDAAGNYAFYLPSGSYVVGALLNDGPNHVEYYAPGTREWQDAAVINVLAPNPLSDIDITIPGASLALPDREVILGQMTTVAVTASEVNGLLGVDLIIGYDPQIVHPTGVHTAGLTSGFYIESNISQPGQLEISLANSTSVTGAGELISIDFETVALGTSLLTIDEALLNGHITLATSGGSLTVCQLFDVTGSVEYFADKQPVPGVTLVLQGAHVHTTTTAADGNYTFGNVREGSYLLTPTKVDDTDAITAYDASLILQTAVNKITLFPEQSIAADVDRSGAINALDASYVLQRAAGLIPLPFPEAEDVWVFEPGERSLPDLSADASSQDFRAILLGDVSGNWAANDQLTAQGESASELSLATARVSPGGTVTIPLSVSSDGLLSADLTIDYDPEVITEVAVSLSSQTAGFFIATNDSVPGRLQVSMASSTAVPGEATLLELSLQVTATPGQQTVIHISKGEINEQSIMLISDGKLLVALPGDANLDNMIDFSDITLVAFQYGQAAATVDMNGDGTIDIFDLVIVGRQLNN
jgi:hypothetical protein